MPAEIDIYGIFVPGFFVLALGAYVALLILVRGLQALGFYRFVWHRPVFNLSLYVCVLGAAFYLSGQALPH